MPVNSDEISEITERNEHLATCASASPDGQTCKHYPNLLALHPKLPIEVGDLLAHILADVHEILRRLSEFEAEARPLLDAYKRTNGGTIGLLKARKAARGG